MSANNKAIIDKANEAFRKNDVAALLALCTEDLTWTMVGSQPAVGNATGVHGRRGDGIALDEGALDADPQIAATGLRYAPARGRGIGIETELLTQPGEPL